ncbi:hypothetical protein FISHEDRAFT_76478 [Fistulina hepatica ATCC 64428]|uniref:Transmembrane protein n=1 Tax=Fistulina hepatica ATCC 64428 TaxID=1128425 RepID=A0A0D7A3L7_9AGAR|nr:hypothetical protein FISHEDRAFT_76478 [Fistulina hepatica ATCC 64428]
MAESTTTTSGSFSNPSSSSPKTKAKGEAPPVHAGAPRPAPTGSPGNPFASKRDVEPVWKDFRPPWVYATVRLLNYVVAPTIIIISIFFWDWGEGDHVFRGPREWAKSYMSLTPAERKIAEEASKPAE